MYPRSRTVVTLLLALLAIAPSARADGPPGSPSIGFPDPAGLGHGASPLFSQLPLLPATAPGARPTIDWKKLQERRTKPLAQYFEHGFDSELDRKHLELDLDAFLDDAARLQGPFRSREFKAWWQRNRAAQLDPRRLEAIRNTPLSGFVLAAYLDFENANAEALDARNPRTKALKAEGKPTEGDNYFAHAYRALTENPVVSVLGAIGLYAAGHKIIDIAFWDAGTQLTHTGVEPVVGPWRDRLGRYMNRNFAPLLIRLGYTQWASGESGAQKKARRAADAGVDLSKDKNLKKYFHPAFDIETAIREEQRFYDDNLAADKRWAGTMLPDYIKARNTGFELLINQYTHLGERLSVYNIGTGVTLLELREITGRFLAECARLGRARSGCESELEGFSKAVERHHDVLTFKGVFAPELKQSEAEIHGFLESWEKAGLPLELAEELYETQIHHIVAGNRNAFALAGLLQAEYFYRENNQALEGLDSIMARQEQNREISGFYDELRKNQKKVQMYFDSIGWKYDVQKRLDERGFPLGGPVRPAGQPPIRDCVSEYLRLAKARRASPPAAR